MQFLKDDKKISSKRVVGVCFSILLIADGLHDLFFLGRSLEVSKIQIYATLIGGLLIADRAGKTIAAMKNGNQENETK